MMPGAPPVKLVSVTEIRCTPFCRNEIVLPTAVTSSCVPAASVPAVVRAAQLVQAPAAPLEQHQLRAAEVPVVHARRSRSARRSASAPPAATHCPPVSASRSPRSGSTDRWDTSQPSGCHRWSPRPSRSPAARRSTSPRQRWPSSSAPSPPLARLKSSEADVPELVAQVTATLVTLADPIVPDPLVTVQVWPAGFVPTVTLYAAPAGQRRGEGERPVRGHAQVVTAVILQHHRPGQPGDRPAHRVLDARWHTRPRHW